MSGGSAPRGRKTEEYFTEKPWSGDSDEHEDWEKVLALKGLELGGELMYKWIRNEGPALTAGNIGDIGRQAFLFHRPRARFPETGT